MGAIDEMRISDIFSKRQKRNSGQTDVYQYDQIPDTLRVQITYILVDLIGRPNVGGSPADGVYEEINVALMREYGVTRMAAGRIEGEIWANFICQIATTEQVLDAIETSIRLAAEARRAYNYTQTAGTRMSVGESVKELNFRFQEASVGYQYESGQMMRIDSQLIHAEVVKPALALLSDPRYKGPEEEFLTAHKDYREGHYKGCLTECLKAFESTMKAICDIRTWSYSRTDTARSLIDTCFKNGLIPTALQSELNALQSVLESGVPTLRNKMSGHGQGAVPTEVPPHVAAYALHLTAANIVFLVNAEKSMR
jgi:hypothetical protein